MTHSNRQPAVDAMAPTHVGAEWSSLGTARGVCEAGRIYAGEYRVLGLLGAGGMGEVYRVEHRTLRAEFALKVLRPEYRARPDIVLRFRAESRALWELKHPNFVQVHHAGEDAEIGPYIVMEVLRGKTLAQLLVAMGRVPVEEALPILIEVADTAEAMHGLGIIHRDLKPANIFVSLRPDRTRTVKLLDLGAAKIVKYGQPATEENRTIGTGRYMSPEHIKGERLTNATDIYSLGHIAYEMLSGRHAFGQHHPGEPTHWEYQMWHLNAEVEPLTAVMQECPPDLSAVVGQAMARSLEHRFQSMAAFASALREVLRRYLVAKAKGATEQMALSRRDAHDTIEEVLSRPGPEAAWSFPSGDRERVGGGTQTVEVETAREPISRGLVIAAREAQAPRTSPVRVPEGRAAAQPPPASSGPPAPGDERASLASRGTVRMDLPAAGFAPQGGPPTMASLAPPHAPQGAASASWPAGPRTGGGELVSNVHPTPPMAHPAVDETVTDPRPGRGGLVLLIVLGLAALLAGAAFLARSAGYLGFSPSSPSSAAHAPLAAAAPPQAARSDDAS